jgi:hypothetical protein
VNFARLGVGSRLHWAPSMRWLLCLVVVAGCSDQPVVTVSVAQLTPNASMQVFVGRYELDETITANGTLSIDDPDGCAVLADDVRLTISREDVQFLSRGGESLALTDNGLHECNLPQFTIPLQDVDAPLVLSDHASSATISAALFAPRTIALTSSVHGAATMTWLPATDKPSTGDISFVADGVTTPLAFTVTGSTITADTSGLAAVSGVLHVEAFSAEVTPDRCDFRSCELAVEQASDVPVTLQ